MNKIKEKQYQLELLQSMLESLESKKHWDCAYQYDRETGDYVKLTDFSEYSKGYEQECNEKEVLINKMIDLVMKMV